MSNNKKWYALYTFTGSEKKITNSLIRKKFEYYCPMNQVFDKINDPKRKTSKPLFPGFVFVFVTEDDHEYLRQLSGVLSIVHWLKEPAIFDNTEIEMIRQFLNVHISVTIEKIAVNIYDKVKVIGNTLTQRGNGELSINRKLVQLFLPSLGFILSADVEPFKTEGTTKKIIYQPKTFEKSSIK